MSQAVEMEQLTSEARRHIELRAPMLVSFAPPVGPLGPLECLRLELGPRGPVALTLTVQVAASTFALLEHEAWFGNTPARRGPNLRGAFDPSAPIALTVSLAPSARDANFGGAPTEIEGALHDLLRRLRTGASDQEPPDAWCFRDATQALPGSPVRLGYAALASGPSGP